MFRDAINTAIKHHELKSDSTLHVIGVVSNPARYHSRYRIAREWIVKMETTPNVRLHLVELALGDRHHEVVSADEPRHLLLRSSADLWHKENLINLGERRLLPRDWKYLLWCDADVFFARENWALETIHELQHYPVIQPWTECVDLGIHGNALNLFRSFSSLSKRLEPRPDRHGVFQGAATPYQYQYGHSGFAWACTREFWENTGGLIDWAVLGSADHHMAWSMLGKVEWSIHQKMSLGFREKCLDWQRAAFRMTGGHLGCVPGRIEHRFHGSKKRRFYRERWDVLIRHGFDPNRDLRRDAQGVLHLTGKPHLEAEIRAYMRARNEDSIDEE